jgi:hypothetical protein
MFYGIILSFTYISVSPVTIISVSYKNNTIQIQITTQKCVIKPLHITLDFSVAFPMVIQHQIILVLKYT